MTIDGVDFRVWEARHPTMPVDKTMGSHKYNKKAALKHKIAVVEEIHCSASGLCDVVVVALVDLFQLWSIVVNCG